MPSGLKPGQHLGAAAGGEEDVLRLEQAALGFAGGDFDQARHIDAALADDVLNLVLLEQKTDALGHLVGDRARALHDLGKIHRDFFALKAVDLGVAHGVVKLGALEQGLGGDATPVEAGAAGALHLDAGDLAPELAGANRARVAGRPAANDDQIINVVFGHKQASKTRRAARVNGAGLNQPRGAGGRGTEPAAAWADRRRGP